MIDIAAHQVTQYNCSLGDINNNTMLLELEATQARPDWITPPVASVIKFILS